MRNFIRPTAAAAALAVIAVLVAILPAGSRRFAPRADAAASCPITVRLSAPSGAPVDIANASAPLFDFYNPGTTLVVTQSGNDDTAIGDVTNHAAEIAISNRPLTANELAGKYEWQLATRLWVSTNDRATSPRIDFTRQVRADDWINYMRTVDGHAISGTYATPPIGPALVPPLPDWDVNLDGVVNIPDLGGVASKWGANSSCRGYIRADANKQRQRQPR